jgi:hypothetical protein
MNFGAILNFFKRHPLATTLGGGSVGLAYIKTQEEGKEENKQQASQQPKQAQQQPKQTSAPSKQSQEPPLPLPPPGKSPDAFGLLPPPPPPIGGSVGTPSGATVSAPNLIEDNDFKELQQQFYSLFAELDKYRQVYDATLEKHMQANELYEKQLFATLSTMSLLLAKTPLNNMTNEDYLHHTAKLFTSMPYANALENFSKLTKGYYLAKMNNVNPSELSTTDLIAIADNPVLAKSADENLAGFLEQIGEVLKLKMKSNLDEIGALKDAYATYRKELEEKGKLLKDLIDLKKVEITLGINQYKAVEMARHHQIMEDIQKEKTNIDLQKLAEKANVDKKKLEIEEKKLQLKEQNKSQKSKKEDEEPSVWK